MYQSLFYMDKNYNAMLQNQNNHYLKYVQRNIQTIITTTDLKNIQKKYLKEAFIFEVKEGKIIRK